MSNIIALIDALSKLSDGELAVLKNTLSKITQTSQNAVSQASQAMNFSLQSLQTQKVPSFTYIDSTSPNPYPANVVTYTPPSYQSVTDYPIIFGNADSTEESGVISNRSITFAFGAKAFLGYANDAKGNPYSDTSYPGGTVTNLGEIEVVNYRTMINAIQANQSTSTGTYLNKTNDDTTAGSVHDFGTVFFRGAGEKVYYGKPWQSYDYVESGGVTGIATPSGVSLTQYNYTGTTFSSVIANLEVAVIGDIQYLQDEINAGLTTSLALKYDKLGGTISGNVDVTGYLRVADAPVVDTDVVRKIDLTSTTSGLSTLPTYSTSNNGEVLIISDGVPVWSLLPSGPIYAYTVALEVTISCGRGPTYAGMVIGTPTHSTSDITLGTGQTWLYYDTDASDYSMVYPWIYILCNTTGDYNFGYLTTITELAGSVNIVLEDLGTTVPTEYEAWLYSGLYSAHDAFGGVPISTNPGGTDVFQYATGEEISVPSTITPGTVGRYHLIAGRYYSIGFLTDQYHLDLCSTDPILTIMINKMIP
jgi:hypothetical protein